MSYILSDFDNFMQFSNDDGDWIGLQAMIGGYLAIKKSDVPVTNPPDVDSLPVYFVKEAST